ncbi:MAG: CAP domain-containing protein [Nitrososphaerales archaeon]|jgi:uncharacterized protein YkwD
MKIYESHRRSVHNEGWATEPAPRSQGAGALFLVALVLIGAFVLVILHMPALMKDGSDLILRLASSVAGAAGISPTKDLNYSIYSPLIQNGVANISYPSDYGALSTYVLSLVNSDRANYGLGAVTLSNNKVGQQHADSMLRYGYFSHNDTQGFKPYMRYSLLGGTGAVDENIAYIYSGFPTYTSTASVEGALRSLEYSMMYKDSQCCSNGHRNNTLSALHNRISVGVAYNGTTVYFVEDFENYCINLNFSVSSSYYVTMTGTPVEEGLSANAVYVTYDRTPSPETTAQLDSGPHKYGPGSPLGGVLPPCYFACRAFEQGITVYADKWTFAPNLVFVTFSLRDFVQHCGAGVYTVYMITGADTSSAITSISIFVS